MTVSPHLRRSFARGLRGLIVVTLLLVTGCKARGCSWSKSGEANLAVTMGKLSADPLTGARELGTAAAKSKDEGALAGKLLAMLERLEVPVLSTDGSKALVTAHLSNPPKEIFFWEPIIVGLARSTVQGDSRPMSVVFRKMFPQADDATVKQLDFSTLFAKLATDVAAAKATTHDALLVTAIAEDLQQRGMPVRDPRIDPVGAALFVMWLSLTQAPAPSPAAGSGVPAIPSNFPGLPPGFKIRGLNNQLPPAPAGAGGYVCSAFASAVAGLGTAYSAFGSATKLGQFAPGGAGTAFGNWNKAMSYGAKLVELPILALEAIVALGIVAFVDINGDVNGSSTSAPKVKYGDPPVKFTMHVASTNPLSKKELDAFINCLEALSTVGAPFWEELRNLPPHGPIGSAPVVWLGWEELDPEHGTFTVDKGWNASKGLKDALAVAGRQLAANGKTSLTTSTGEATAEFKPKPKPGPTQKFTTIVKSVNVYANLFPFPVSTSKVYGVANVLFSREVPLRLELELPFPKDWVMTVHQETDTTGQGVSGGWKLIIDATIPFSLDPSDPKRAFKGQGAGTWTFDFKGGFGGLIQCSAPLGSHALEAKVNGSILDTETFNTVFGLDISSKREELAATMKCTGPNGVKVNAPINAPSHASNSAFGTALERFQMVLGDRSSRDFFITYPGPGTTAGSAVVTLTPAMP